MKRGALIFGLAAAMAGCTVGPDYQRPDIAMAPAFRSPMAATPLTASPVPQTTGWWRAFGDPVLDRAVERALEGNLDLAQAVARVSQSRAAAAVASAAKLPAISATSSATGTMQSLEGQLGNIFSRFPQFERNNAQFDAGIGASWEIDLFGGLQRGNEAARAELLASTAGIIGARQMIVAEVADAYIQLRAAQGRLAIAVALEGSDSHLRDLVAMNVRAGLAPRRDLDLAEAQLKETQSRIPALRLIAEVQMNRIAVLAGQSPEAERTDLEEATAIPSGASVSLGLPADLLRNRPDVIAAEQRLRAGNARIGQAISGYYPKFSLSALLGLQSRNLSALPTASAGTATAVFGLRWRLFDFGRIDAEVASARGREAELGAAYRLAVLRAAEDVENAAAARFEREAQLVSMSAMVQSLERSVNALQAAHGAGTVSLIDVLGAQRQLSGARDAAAQLSGEVSRAAVSIARAVGA